MTQFNADDYFDRRAYSDLTQKVEGSTTGLSKYEELMAASAAKTAVLEQVASDKAANADSWASKLTSDPSGIAGSLINLGASVYAGTSRLAGQVAAIPDAVSTAIDINTVSPDAVEARNRFKQGLATAKDMALLNDKRHQDDPYATPEENATAKAQLASSKVLTNLQLLDRAAASVERGRNITDSFDRSSVVNATNRDGLNAALDSGFADAWKQYTGGGRAVLDGAVLKGGGDIVAGMARLVYNAGDAAVHNKRAVLEYAAENAPQLLLGLAGKGGTLAMGVTNVGYAMDTFQQGMQNYAMKHNGAMPSEDERQTMAFQAATLALAEQTGDMFQIGAMKGGKIAEVGSRDALKAALKRTGTAAIEGAVGESATEGYQTYMEGQITGKPVTAADIYKGAVIGGLSGGILSGGGHTVNELVGATPERVAAQEKQIQDKADFQAAVAANDPAPFLTPENYRPDRAVGVLFKASQSENMAPEAKQENLTKARDIVATLEDTHANAVDDFNFQRKTPEQKTASLDAMKEKIAALDPADPQAKAIQDVVTAREGLMETLTPIQLKAKAAEISNLDRQKTAATALQENLADLVRTKVSSKDIAQNIAVATTPVDPADTVAVETARKAADTVISLSMVNTAALTHTDAIKLADNTSNGLSDAQRGYLREFSKARIAENLLMSITSVKQDVMNGDEKRKQLGITNYRKTIGQALEAGDKNKADKYVAMLENFANDHADKAKLVSEALKEIGDTGIEIQIVNMDGKWQRAPQKLNDTALIANGGLSVHKASGRLASSIKTEAAALTQAVAEQQAAYSLKFGNAPTTQVATTPTQAVGAAQTAEVVGGATQTTTTTPVVTPVTQTTAAPTSVVPVVPTQPKEEVNAQAPETKQSQSQEATQAATEVEAVGSSIQELDQDLTIEDIQNEITTTEAEIASEDGQAAEQSTSDTSKETDASVVASPGTQEAINADAGTASTSVVKESGVLSTLKQVSVKGTLYKARNLLADFFAQKAGTKADASVRALVDVKDFLTKWNKAPQEFDVTQYLKDTDQETLTDAQNTVLTTFRKQAAQWNALYQKSLVRGYWNKSEGNSKPNPNFKFTDLMQFLIEETDIDGKTVLDLEENVKTAMSAAAFLWVAENAGKSAWNTPTEINMILGVEEDAPVEPKAYAILGKVGTRENVVRNALGQKAIAALGLKAKANAPKDLMARLEGAMGAHIQKMLMDQKILVRNPVSGADMASLTGNEKTDKNAAFNFLAIARDDEGKAMPLAQKISEDSKATQGILNKVFSVEPGVKEPSLKPIKSAQTTTRNTRQGIPSVLAKIVQKANAEANYIRGDMYRLVGMLSDKVQQGIAGVEEVSTETTHVTNRASIEAKNDGLIRELSSIMDYVGGVLTPISDALDMPIYFEHSVWKQQRVGIATNVINPQSSKIHRFMVYRKSWETKVDMNDLDNFKLRVMEGLGVKTDKQANVDSLAQYATKINDPVIQEAVDVLQRTVLQGWDMMPADEQKLLAGVKKGGSNFHSLDALMALAIQAEAVSKGETSFTVQMMGEIDGVTNGPMLSHLLLGAAATVSGMFNLLNRGGFFQIGSAHNQYNVWRGSKDSQGNPHQDLYEVTTQHVMQAITSMMGMVSNPTMDAIYAFTGTLMDNGNVSKAGRNIIKTPLTAMIFGSTIDTSINNMADNFVTSIYGVIEDLAKGKGDRLTVIKHLNTLLTKENQIPLTETVAELMEIEFKGRDLDALRNQFLSTIGEAVSDVIKQDFASFMEARQQLNTTAKLAFELYNAAYTGMRDAYIQELMDSGEIDFVKTKGINTPIQDLNAEQEDVLRERLKGITPILQTAMSKQSNEPDTGLMVSKSAKRLSEKGTHKGVVQFSTPFADGDTHSVSTTGYETVESDPGVAMAPMSVHSTDSAISHTASAKSEVLNVHDAHGTGLGGFQQTAQNLNEATWTTLLDYSPLSEVRATLSNVITGLAALVESKDLPPAVLSNLRSVLAKTGKRQKLSAEKVLVEMLHSIDFTAHQANNMKYSAMAEMASVDQYALEGGNYQVSDADRAIASSRIASFQPGLSKEEKTSISAILAKVMKSGRPVVQEQQGVTEEDTKMDSDIAASNVLQIPVVQAMQLLEHGSKDATLAKDVQQQMSNLLVALWKGGTTLKQEVIDQLSRLDAANMVQLLSARFNALPKGYWGELGVPAITSDAALVNLFEQKSVLTSKQVISVLRQKLSQGTDSKTKAFNLKMLSVLERTVSADLRIRYITPNTPADLALTNEASGSRGWYAMKNGKEEIYVLSPEFKSSGLTAEVLLHELVHAALSQVIETKGKGPATALIAELETLRTKAQDYASKNGMGTKYAAALSSVHELVSWGMSNLDFQTNVLNQITMPSSTKENILVTGMQKFIKALTDFLFTGTTKSEQEVLNNGMSVLISNVSGLFYQAAQNKTNLDVSLAQTNNASNTYSTLDIYAALNTGAVSSAFDTQLREVLNGIVEKLHGTYGSFKEAIMKDTPKTAVDIFTSALASGNAPFASKSMASAFQISNQEAFVIDQVEATVRAALDSNLGPTAAVYSELGKLFMETRTRLTEKDFHKGDWSIATQQEKDLAKERYDFIFNRMDTSSSKSDYLAQFAAMGLGHEEFNALLQAPTKKISSGLAGKTVSEALGILFNRLLDVFNGLLTDTHTGQQADAKLTALVKQLAIIESKKRAAAQPTGPQILGSMEKAIQGAAEKARTKVGDIASSQFFKQSKNAFVRAGATVVSVIAKDQLEVFIEGTKKFHDEHFTGKQNVIAGVIDDIRGPKPDMQVALQATKRNEGERKTYITQTGKVVLEGFIDGGKNLTKEAKKALTAVMLRTGAHVLMEHFDLPQMASLVSGGQALQSEVTNFENKLNKFPLDARNYMKEQAKALGYFLITGKATVPYLLRNADNIANLFGSSMHGQLTTAQVAEAAGIVDALTSLYALQYVASLDRVEMNKVFKEENARTDKGNGVELTLLMHKKLEEDARERLFSGNEVLMVKGYTPEIYNHNTDIKVANLSEGQTLVDLGYTPGAQVAVDPADPDGEVKNIYVLRDGGMLPWLSGIFSYTGMRAKGSKQHGVHDIGKQQQIMKGKQAKIDNMGKNPKFEPSDVKTNYMVPLLNASGAAVNFSYLMHDSTKNTVLERNNNFEEVLGAYAGNIVDKLSSAEQNSKAVQVLFDEYKESYGENPKAFIMVGPNSPDMEAREIYAMLPASTKQAIRDVWDKEGMLVRADMMDISFGYRKLSLSNAFEKEEDARNFMESMFVGFVERALDNYGSIMAHRHPNEAKKYANYSKRGAVYVRRSEKAWQALVKEVKDIFVIKSGAVLLGNVSSNITLLKLHGVSWSNMVRDHQVAFRGAEDYLRDTNELFRWKAQLDAGYLKGTASDEAQRQVTRLEDALARNPVKSLIDAGLMPSIVEDMAAEEDVFSYQSQFAKKVNDFTSRLNPKVNEVARGIYMAHDTSIYKTLSHITQLSDFVARYTLYQHLITRAEKPLSVKDAIKEATDSFINYDVPMHRQLQYTDDIGVTMFTKYFLRIQRVLLRRMKDSPGRVAMLMLADHYFSSLASVTDSSMWQHVGNNPISSGALQYPGSLDELMTMKAGLSLFK